MKRSIGLAVTMGALVATGVANASQSPDPAAFGAKPLAPASAPVGGAVTASAVRAHSLRPADASSPAVGSVHTNMTPAPPSIPRTPMRFRRSPNWAGYINTGISQAQFNETIVYWTVPRYTCKVRRLGKNGTQAGQWVGIDGAGSRSVEQEGTSVNCFFEHRHLRRVTTVWYEMYPKNPVPYVGAVKPGDTMGAMTKYVGNGEFELYIKDFSNGKYIDTTQTCTVGCALHSAEAISELPGSGIKGGTTLTKTSRFPFYGYYNQIYYAPAAEDLYGYFGATNYWQTTGSIIDDPYNHGRTLGTISGLLKGGRAFWFNWKHGY